MFPPDINRYVMCFHHCFRSGSSWLRPYPRGLRHALNWVRDQYNNVTVYITENGVSDRDGSLEDTARITYLRDHVNEVLKGQKYMVWVVL